jgi:hypothetical protein
MWPSDQFEFKILVLIETSPWKLIIYRAREKRNFIYVYLRAVIYKLIKKEADIYVGLSYGFVHSIDFGFGLLVKWNGIFGSK